MAARTTMSQTIRLVLWGTLVAMVHVAGLAVPAPENRARFETPTVGVVLVTRQESEDVPADNQPSTEVDAQSEEETDTRQRHLDAAVQEVPQPVPSPVREPRTDPVRDKVVVPAPVSVSENPPQAEVPPEKTEQVPVAEVSSPPRSRESESPSADPDRDKDLPPPPTTREASLHSAQVAATGQPEALPARPRYGHHPPPAYPRIARQRGWQGIVVYEVRILPSGKVAELVLASSSGFRVLDEAAGKAIRQWRFHPATRFGTPVESWVQVPVEFVLE